MRQRELYRISFQILSRIINRAERALSVLFYREHSFRALYYERRERWKSKKVTIMPSQQFAGELMVSVQVRTAPRVAHLRVVSCAENRSSLRSGLSFMRGARCFEARRYGSRSDHDGR